jgi:hypothetical protein
MNHNEAIELQAAAKYVLGELSPVQREEYEDHYIDCPECAKDVHAAAAFADATREVFRQEKRAEAAKSADRVRGWRFAWLKPAVAVPAFAVLLLVVAYQNTVTIPRAKEAAMRTAGQLITSSFFLQMANTRGGEEVKVAVHPNESFALKFDFTPKKSYDSYVCRLEDEKGRSVLEESVPGTSTNQEAQFVVPAGRVKPGKYSLVFTGVAGSQEQGNGEEVLRLRFTVELLQ